MADEAPWPITNPLPPSVVTDSSATPKTIDSTGVSDTNVLAYNTASGKFLPAAAGAAAGAVPSTATTGAPTAGTWAVGQIAIDTNKGLWKCIAAGAPGTWQRIVGSLTPQEFGCKGDAIWVTDAAMTSASATLTCATSTPFTSTAVDGGKLIAVSGAGAAGVTLVTTISTVTDSSHAVLAANAGTTVSTKTAMFGTDDTANLRTWLAALGGSVTGLVTARHMTAIATTPFAANARSGLTIAGQGGGVTVPSAIAGAGPTLTFMPQAALINTTSGATSFIATKDSPGLLWDGVAVINANSAHTGTLLDSNATLAGNFTNGQKFRGSYIGGMDAGAIGTALGGQQGALTRHCQRGIFEDCVFAFSDVGWSVSGGSSANAMTARACGFYAYGTVACLNPGEATTWDQCSFGLKYAAGVAANQLGAAVSYTAGYQGWDASASFLNCHFQDTGSGSTGTHWITAGNSAGAYGGIIVSGGYWGGTTADTLVWMTSTFDNVYIIQSGSGSVTLGGGQCVPYNANGQTVRTQTTVGG